MLILTFIRFVISKQQSLGDIVFAIAGFRSYLPVQLCVGVIEGVDMVLRRLVYCDTAILIYVSGNYIERVEKCLWRRWKIYLCTRWVGNAKKGVKFERQHACAFRIWTITLVSNNRARMDYQYFLQACFCSQWTTAARHLHQQWGLSNFVLIFLSHVSPVSSASLILLLVLLANTRQDA